MHQRPGGCRRRVRLRAGCGPAWGYRGERRLPGTVRGLLRDGVAAAGWPEAGIADRLCLSPQTAADDLTQVFTELETRARAEAVVTARQRGRAAAPDLPRSAPACARPTQAATVAPDPFPVAVRRPARLQRLNAPDTSVAEVPWPT
jgi:hypothetical protein